MYRASPQSVRRAWRHLYASHLVKTYYWCQMVADISHTVRDFMLWSKVGFFPQERLLRETISSNWTAGIRGNRHTRATTQMPARLSIRHRSREPVQRTCLGSAIEMPQISESRSSNFDTLGLQTWTVKRNFYQTMENSLYLYFSWVYVTFPIFLMFSPQQGFLRAMGNLINATWPLQPCCVVMWMIISSTEITNASKLI